MTFGEKDVLLNKSCSGTSYSTTGCEFNVNESIVYVKQGIFQQKNTLNKVMYWSADETAVTKGSKITRIDCIL